MTKVERDGHRDGDRDDDREAGELDVLQHADGDAMWTLPVRGIGEPPRHVAEESHASLVHGVSARCRSTSAASATIAKAIDPTAPTRSGVLKSCCIPSRMK